jgi:hypothetical protein
MIEVLWRADETLQRHADRVEQRMVALFHVHRLHPDWTGAWRVMAALRTAMAEKAFEHLLLQHRQRRPPALPWGWPLPQTV